MTLPVSSDTVHLIIELSDGKQLEHERVATDDTLWNILCRFESQFNHNLCRRRNNENRFELPQLMYNKLPFAATLQQLLGTKLSDITKHRSKPGTPLILKLVFKAQAFNVNEVETRIQKIQQERDDDDVELKNDEDDDGDTAMKQQQKKQNGLPSDFADDIDAAQAQNTEVIFRKMEVSLYALCKLLRTPSEFVACLKLLRRIVLNLVSHPLPSPSSPASPASATGTDKDKDVRRYRKLNLQNEKLRANLFRYEPALQLLQCIGFQRTNDEASLILLPEHENVVIFQALIVKIDNCAPPKEAVPVVEKQVKIYELRDVQQFKVKEAQIIATQNVQKNNSSDAALSAQHRKAMQNAYKRNHPTQLMGKEMREKKYGVKQKEYKFTVIRVEFPSHKVLEAKFHPNAPITELFEFVHDSLTDAVKTYAYELVLPPDQVIKTKQENLTFKGVGGMIPACTVRFRFGKKITPKLDVKESYIRSELIEKYITTDITSLRSDQLENVVSSNDDAQSSNDKQKEVQTNDSGNEAKDKQLLKAQIKARQKVEAAKRRLQKMNE